MAVSQARKLLAQSNPNPSEITKSIAALTVEAEYIRKCIKANLRDYDSGQKAIDEIRSLIKELEQKL
jgi:hypothetical protein